MFSFVISHTISQLLWGSFLVPTVLAHGVGPERVDNGVGERSYDKRSFTHLQPTSDHIDCVLHVPIHIDESTASVVTAVSLLLQIRTVSERARTE